MDTFMGQSIAYWVELHKKARILNVVKWLEEIAELRAKVSFYESRIKEMTNFMERNEIC